MAQGGLYFAEEAIGGLSAGVIGTVIGFPLDTIKTRMMVSSGSHGIFSVGRSIVKNEGISALYRGLVPPLLSLSALNTITFASYSYFRQEVFHASSGWDVRNALSGSCIAPFSSMISTVENVIKTQVQIDNVREKRFKGSLHCLKTVTASHGLGIIYTGHLVNTTRECVFLGTYFFVYEGFREMLFFTHKSLTSNSNSDKPSETHQNWAIPLSGGLAGSVAWFVSFPLDCIRAGVQGQSFNDSSPRKGAFEVAKGLMKTRGIRGLYSGVTPSIVRAFLVSGSRFSAYEGALWLLRGGRDNDHS